MCLSSGTRGYRNALRVLPQLLAGWLLAAATGCVTVYRHLPLSTPATASTAQLTATVPKVAVSVDVVDTEISDGTRLLVAVDLTASKDTRIDLRESRLLYGSERERSPVATGAGEPPRRLTEETFAPPLQLQAARTTRAWLVFGGFKGPVPEIPTRIRLRLQSDLELAISDPGNEPLWEAPPVRHSIGTGPLWIQWSQDEVNLNAILLDNHHVIGPLVLSYRWGFGLRPFYEHDLAFCCNVAAALDIALPTASGSVVWSPYFGVEGAMLVAPHDQSSEKRRFWIGPVLGLEIGYGRLRARHGPFPIAQSPSLLSHDVLRIGFTNWFGDHRPFPSIGVIFSLSLAIGG